MACWSQVLLCNARVYNLSLCIYCGTVWNTLTSIFPGLDRFMWYVTTPTKSLFVYALFRANMQQAVYHLENKGIHRALSNLFSTLNTRSPLKGGASRSQTHLSWHLCVMRTHWVQIRYSMGGYRRLVFRSNLCVCSHLMRSAFSAVDCARITNPRWHTSDISHEIQSHTCVKKLYEFVCVCVFALWWRIHIRGAVCFQRDIPRKWFIWNIYFVRACMCTH